LDPHSVSEILKIREDIDFIVGSAAASVQRKLEPGAGHDRLVQDLFRSHNAISQRTPRSAEDVRNFFAIPKDSHFVVPAPDRRVNLAVEFYHCQSIRGSYRNFLAILPRRQ